jgi:hypothetical protein
VDARVTRPAGELGARRLAARRPNGECPGCGIVLPRRDGPRHAYLGASAACWSLYQRLSCPSSASPDPSRVRRLIGDAYAAQHPGVEQVRSVQSVAVHLMDLCVLLERDGEVRRPARVLGRTQPRRAVDLHWLAPPEARGSMTLIDAIGREVGALRAERVEAWAAEVWAAWELHHATVRRWLDAVPARRVNRSGPIPLPASGHPTSGKGGGP